MFRSIGHMPNDAVPYAHMSPKLIHSDPEILRGTPVFMGTRSAAPTSSWPTLPQQFCVAACNAWRSVMIIGSFRVNRYGTD